DTTTTDPTDVDDGTWAFGENPGGTVGASVINTLLSTGSVTLEARSSLKQDVGANITSATSGSALTLDSKGDIELDAGISLTNANVQVLASNSIDIKGTSSIATTGTGTITLAAGASPAVARTSGTSPITLESGSTLTAGTGLITVHAIDAVSIS